MKKYNFSLWIGIILLIVLMSATLYPEKFTKKDPKTREQFFIQKVIVNGQETHKVLTTPWGPNEKNLLGTDEDGRDIYARLVYGTKYTLKTALLVVLLRLLLALPLGILAGIGSKSASVVIRFFNTVFTAIPTLFAAFFILNIPCIAILKLEPSIVAFAVVLTVLGWAKLAKQIEERASGIMKGEFIEGEIAVGKNKIQIAVQNMIPHLIPFLISIIFIEVGLVIFLLAQLSILETFVGPRYIFKREMDSTGWMMADNPEWASMLSRTVINNRVGNYWVGLYPALVFAIGIMAFNLTGEGLKIEFEKRKSRIVTSIRRLGYIFSPKIYFQQLVRFKEYYKPIIAKTLCMGLIFFYITIPPPANLYSFEISEAMVHLEELSKPQYQGRYAGYEGGYLAGDYILKNLKEFGLQPYDSENYFQYFPLLRKAALPNNNPNQHDVNGFIRVQEATIKLTAYNGEVTNYQLKKDFDIITIPISFSDNPTLVDEEGYINLHGISSSSKKEERDHLSQEQRQNMMLVEEVKEYRDMYKRIEHIKDKSTLVTFYILENHTKPRREAFVRPYYTIIPSEELADKLKKGHHEVEVRIKKPIEPESGRNILAVLPGKDWDIPNDSNDKKEVIIIGSTYDGLYSDNISGDPSSSATAAAINLEIARVLSNIEEPLDKTIVFAFWDGAFQMFDGCSFYNLTDRYFNQKEYTIYYLDVGYASGGEQINIEFKVPALSKTDTFNMTNIINNRMNKKKIDYVNNLARSRTFQSIGDNMSLKVSVEGPWYEKVDNTDYLDNMKKQMENIGQFCIDFTTLEEHFK